MAVEQVFGATTAWTSDVDPGACKIIAHRFPDAPNLGDITTIDWANVEPVDIIAGGSPCQDVSTAGRRAGMTEGTRSNLWTAMREGIAHVRPRFVVWENVRGATSATAASAMESDPRLLGDHPTGQPVLRALGRVLGDLADLGYDAQWCGLRASDVGAPHQRFRVFLLAHPGGVGGERRRAPGNLAGAPRPGEADREQRERYGDAAHHRRATTTDPGRLCGIEGRHTAPGEAQSGRALCDLGGHGGVPATDADHAGLEGRTANGERSGQLPAGPGSLAVPWGRYGPAIRRWEQATGHPAPAPTDERNRLTAAFPEWMMGLPPGWITDVPGVTRNEALKACGNGVVPQQAIAALTHMINNLEH